MSAILLTILRVAGWILTGVGLGSLVERFIAPKIPAYYGNQSLFPKIKLPGILWVIGVFFIAWQILKWAGKTFKVSFLKKQI